ncbi:MAG: hypothetical protein COA79_12555 [Planctomycetota bacterium]|nr:MAG: hypothetical protein COA79_12555 [Planctomycetota bacterium]
MGISFIWFSINGYIAFEKDAEGVKKIDIHSPHKLRSELGNIIDEGKITSIKDRYEEAYKRSILKSITNKDDIETFVSGIKPSVFSFNLLGCMCSGDRTITYKYDDGSTFKYNIAHGKTIKMAGYRDLDFKNKLGDLLPALPLDEE